jgi:uncharacterized membrane protein
MPEQMASHWNSQGEVDGYMPRFWGLFLMPIVLAGMYALFVTIPKIDPLKHNIQKFMNYYEGFIVLIIAFMFYVHSLTLLWALGVRFDMLTMMAPALGLLFYYIGILTPKAKRNWFIGIRTPWTLSSDRVWNKTHKIAGKLFKACGVIVVFSVLLPDYALWLIMGPILFTAVYTIVYSYVEYQKRN